MNDLRDAIARIHDAMTRGRRFLAHDIWRIGMPGEQIPDGFIIAQKDLELRGPGELFGFRQSGSPAAGPAASLFDTQLLALSHNEVARLFRAPDDPETQSLIRSARERYSQKLRDIAMN